MSPRKCFLSAAILAFAWGIGVTTFADDTADFFAAVERAEKLNQAAEYAAAAKEYESVLAISARGWGETHSNHLVLLNNLANVYRKLGRFAEAEPIYLRVLKSREATLGSDHPDVVLPLINLAILYGDLGQFQKAEPLYRRALKIQEARLKPNHPDIAVTLTGQASLYQQHGWKTEAESLYMRALKIREAAFGADHPEVARSLVNLAIVYSSTRRLAEAEPLLLRSLKILETQRGPEHPQVAETLTNLAILYQRQGRYAEAEPLQKRSLRILEVKLGATHPDVGKRGYHNLALLEISLRRPREAAAAFDRARRIVRRHAATALPLLADAEQLFFLNQVDRRDLQIALSLAFHAPNDVIITDQSAAWLANGKAVAQDSLAVRAQAVRDAHDPGTAAAAKQLSALRSELASLSVAPPTVGQEETRRSRLATLSIKEQTLAKQIAALRGGLPAAEEWIATDRLRQSLPADTVLVDFARMYLHSFEREPEKENASEQEPSRLPEHYVAWITPPAGAAAVQVVDLGPTSAIDAALSEYQASMKLAQSGTPIEHLGESKAEEALRATLSELARLTIAPLQPHLEHARRLILSPDAGLWLMPWAALPVGEQYAVERWEMRYVTSGREVVLEKLRRTTVTPGPARILANPDYDLPRADLLAAYNALLYPGQKPPTAALTSPAEVARPAAFAVAALPGTAIEAALVAPHLRAFTQAEPRVYLDRQAQEGVLKLIKNPRVLLLSTHGFFLPDDQAVPALAEAVQRLDVVDDGASLPNPLLRCGVLLASCNQGNTNIDPNLGDGVLTGLEIIGCDLRGTELVVLSACETGLGKVNNGEGVAGLRQAFQLAGARSVVSTLWQIPDRQSAVLMSDFFTNLAAGQSKAESLRNAQLAMIKSRREKYGAAHPLFWAAWTVTGN